MPDGARAGRGPPLCSSRLRWPRWLRGKWLGLALLVLVLFSYELFDLWSMPRATAWLVLGYFGLAIVVDSLFSGASFCKHLCPIGQFNFTASTMSPTELRIVDRETCRSCRTSDCIKGRFSGPVRLKPDTRPGDSNSEAASWDSSCR